MHRPARRQRKAGRRQPWLVIDPKPYLGDPTYDPLQHMLNCPDRLLADPDRFADRMAALLDLEANRLRHWLFARWVLESVDRPVLGGWPQPSRHDRGSDQRSTTVTASINSVPCGD